MRRALFPSDYLLGASRSGACIVFRAHAAFDQVMPTFTYGNKRLIIPIMDSNYFNKHLGDRST